VETCTVKKNELQVFLPTRKFLPNTIILKDKKRKLENGMYNMTPFMPNKQVTKEYCISSLDTDVCLEVYRKKL